MKERILLATDADLSSSYVEHITGSRGKSYCKYKERAGWSARNGFLKLLLLFKIMGVIVIIHRI